MGITQVSISKQYEVSISTIERIVNLYNKHGFKYLRDKSKNSRYTAEFKLELMLKLLVKIIMYSLALIPIRRSLPPIESLIIEPLKTQLQPSMNLLRNINRFPKI